MQRKRNLVVCIAFIAIQCILYGLILSSSDKLLIWSEFISIVLCFLFALVSLKAPLMICGLAMTVCADYCLVVCDPIRQLWGMIFFLGAQSFYALKLHRQGLRRGFLWARLGLSVAAVALALLVLGENVDALAMVSMCYYVNLIMNMICAFVRFRDNRLMAIGFVLFILCDTVIGLQVAAAGYLPIPEGSLIHNIIFSGFHLSWFFYLPSQVLLALSSRKNK